MSSRATDGTGPEPTPSLGGPDGGDREEAEAQTTPEDLERSRRLAGAIGRVAVRTVVSRA